MKIGIVTVYNGNNYGAFLQAFSLENYLQEKGHEVYFVKNNARNLGKLCLKKIAEKIMRAEKRGYLFQFKKMMQFRKAISHFKECDMEDVSALDMIILGSDEIWNVGRKNINRYPVFFGEGIKNQNIVSYAPSINNTQEEDFEKFPECIASLKKINRISVRDNYSKTIMSKVLKEKEVFKVVDPTLLHEKEFYLNCMEKTKVPKSFILLYSYGTHLKQEIIDEIIEFSRKNDLKIVSILEYFEWCDCNVTPTPYEMLYYFYKAKYIITDTFHGTIFSMIYNKNFVVSSKSSIKIMEILKEFGLEGRVLDKVGKIDLLRQEINYNQIQAIVKELQYSSREYLDKCIT